MAMSTKRPEFERRENLNLVSATCNDHDRPEAIPKQRPVDGSASEPSAPSHNEQSSESHQG